MKCEYNGAVFYIPPATFSRVVLRCQYPEKKYIRYKDGAELYSMSEREFNTIAHNAGAVYKVNKMALVSVDAIDKFLEFYKVE